MIIFNTNVKVYSSFITGMFPKIFQFIIYKLCVEHKILPATIYIVAVINQGLTSPFFLSLEVNTKYAGCCVTEKPELHKKKSAYVPDPTVREKSTPSKTLLSMQNLLLVVILIGL